MTKRKEHTYRGISFTKFDPVPNYWGGEDYAPTLKQLCTTIDMAAAILNSPPPEFNMSDYGDISPPSDDKVPEKFHETFGVGDNYWHADINPHSFKKWGKQDIAVVTECGTTACAIGTSAYHGVGKITKDMVWDEYAVINFGIAQSDVWEFVFGAGWADYDNTPEGAVMRILMLVIEGGAAVTSFVNKNGRDDTIAYYQKYKDIKIGPK